MTYIKDIQGSTLLTVEPCEGSRRRFELMKEDSVTLRFSLASPVDFPLGSYVETPYGRFEITSKQYPNRNVNTGGYDYELRFNAHCWKWNNKIFKYTPEYGGQEASWSLTADLQVHASIVIRNQNALGYKHNNTAYTFSIDSTVERKPLALTYDNMYLLDACFAMAQAAECDCWITDNIIHFGRMQHGDAFTLENLVNCEMSRSDSKDTFATRIYAFGGTRNLPTNYRHATPDIVVNGVVQKRLMLPEGTPYIDAYPGMSTEQAVEQIVVFDEIYPRRVGTMNSITTKEYTDTIQNPDGTTTEEKWNAYRFTDTGITFSKDYTLPGEALKIVFQSGKLNGLEFEVAFDPDDKGEQLWEIIASDTYGRRLPDAVLIPEVGDTYVLSGFDASKLTEMGYIAAAEQELKEKATAKVARMKIDPNTYTCKQYATDAYRANGAHNILEPGQAVNLVNPAYFADGRQSRVIGVEFPLDYPYDNPVYTVGESAAYSRLGDMQGKIESLTIAGQTYTGSGNGSGIYLIKRIDSTPATDSNAFSAARSLDTFLRRDKSDRTPYSLGVGGDLTVDGDTNTPSLTADRFVEGWLGKGGRLWYDPVTGKTKLEVDEIRARDVFETLAFRFNQVDVISGEMWNTFAFGTIKSVDTEKKIVNLDLVDGELMTVKPNDLLRGIFHHLTGANNTSDGVDDCGFPKIQGFTTSYFTPVSLLPDGTGFRYALRAGTTVHPQPGMKFAAYGNFTDKSRQSSTYSTRTRLIMLNGVNTWVIDPAKHYQYVRGELNMEYGGMKFDGHGTIQKNSYIYGSQIFFTDKDKEELQGESAYSVNLSDYEGIVTLDLDGNIVDGVRQTQNVVTGDLNVTTDNETLNVVTNGCRLSARIQAFKGKKELFYSEEFTEGGFTVRLYPVGCTAIVENGIIEITSISNPDSCYVDIEVNCEGEAVFTKTYKVTAVTNGYSPLYIDLDNEMDSVACDSDGRVLFGLPLVTNVSMFYGSKKLTLKTLAVTTESGVTFTATKETGRVAVTYIPDNTTASFAVHINATADYDGKEYGGSAVFTINKVKTSAIYNLQPSVSDIKVERNKDNGLVYKTTSVSCKVRKNDGTQTTIPSTLPAGMYMRVSADKGTETAYTYGASVSVTSLLTSIEFRLYNSAGTLIDTETIPVVVDGSNGESNVIADLDNEMDSVACDAEGNWLFGNPQTTVSMYYGSTKLTLDSLTLDCDTGINATSNASTGLVRVTSVDKAAKDVSQIRMTLKATYKGEQYTRVLTFTINKVKTSAIYNLQPSVSAVKKAADGTPTVSSVSCKVRKYDGVTTDTMTTLPSGYTMKYSTDDGAENAYTYGTSISVSSISKKIQFLLYYGGKTVDVETVPVVSDGKKGEDGEPGKDGVSSFKSTVFLRSNTTPVTPSGGSFTSPIPTTSPVWSDGIPAGAAMLWASTRIFSFDGKAPQQSGWSKPAQMTDTADFDVEFSSLENPNPPVGHPNTNSQWGNASGTSTVWMATSRCKNGAWSDWEVSKIKGEKGDAGTGIQIKGSKPTVDDLPMAGNTVGDCYTVNGTLYVWDGYKWENAGNIKGEPGAPGATPYIHIKFSDDGKNFTANDGETPGKYMGVLVDYNVGDSGVFNAYTWNKFRGDDGYFYEYIYKRTTTAVAPATPTTNSQADDYVPKELGWTDDPTGVSVDYPYEWQCYRKKENGVWGAFIGSHADNTKAVLWAKYGDKGETGNGIASETVYYLATSQATGVTTGTAGWTTSYPQISKDKKYLWSYTLTKYTDGTQKVDGPKLIGVYGDTGLQGCIMRMFENGITVGQFYHNDIDNPNAVYRYIDHIAVPNDNYQSGYAVYRCKSNANHGYTAVSVEDYNNTTYWEAVEMNANAAFFTYLLAKNAYIKMLSGASMVVQGEVQKTDPGTGEPVVDGNGDPVMEIQTRGGMQGDDTKPIFWAGADERLMEDAPYRVMADGTAYLWKMEARGSLTAGDKDGQRIEISPETKSVIVYDADGNECATMDGNTYTSSEILPDGTYKQLTINTISGGSLTSLVGLRRESMTYILSQAAYTDKPGVLTADFGATSLSLTAMFPMSGDSTGLIGNAMASIVFYLETYSDEALTLPLGSRSFGSITAMCSIGITSDLSGVPPRPISMSVVKGWHILKAVLFCQAGRIGVESIPATARATWKLNSARIVSDTYIARFFGNGLCLSKSMDEHLMAIVENGHMNVSVASGGRKFAINNGSVTVNGVKQPVTVYAGKVTDTSTSSSVAPSKTDVTSIPGKSVTVTKQTTKGRYTVNFTADYGVNGSDTMVTVCGFGSVAGTDTNYAKATVLSISSMSVTVGVSDDETPNYGSFLIEVKRYL